jgi:hypothetical protein
VRLCLSAQDTEQDGLRLIFTFGGPWLTEEKLPRLAEADKKRTTIPWGLPECMSEGID